MPSVPVSKLETPTAPSTLEFTQENFRRVAEHFRSFWTEIGQHMVEREDLVAQAQLALLSGQHLLMLGHPGTAKSAVARQSLKRIVGEVGLPNVFDMQFQVESRRAEVVGPRLPQTDGVTGTMKLVAQIEEGIAHSDYAFLDEIFDAPPAVLRGALLTILVDRVINDGKVDHAIALRTAFAASNKTMEQLRSKFGNELDALLDRFAFVYWTTKRPLSDSSAVKIITKDGQRTVAKRQGKPLGLEVPPMLIAEMDLLRTAVARVQDEMVRQQWPLQLAAKFYRTYHAKIDDREEEFGQQGSGGGRSKLESQRTQNVIISLLPAIAVMRHLNHPETPLAVMPEDFKELRHFMMMRGPVVSSLPTDLDAIGEREDARVLKRLKIEDEVFNETFNDVINPAATDISRRIPANFGAIKASVENWKSRITARNFPPDEATDGLQKMEVIMGELTGFASQVAGGEEVYAVAVTTYIRLLVIVLQNGNVILAREKFRDAQPHIDSFRNSFYRSPVDGAVNDFKQKLVEAY